MVVKVWDTCLKNGRLLNLLLQLHADGKLVSMVNGSSHSYQYDIIVLGGGSGGLAASKEAARSVTPTRYLYRQNLALFSIAESKNFEADPELASILIKNLMRIVPFSLCIEISIFNFF